MSAPVRVGTKVICVDTTNFVRLYNETFPVMNGTYTIRQIVNNPDGSGGKCYKLREIVNTPAPYLAGVQECCFKAARFAVKHGR